MGTRPAWSRATCAGGASTLCDPWAQIHPPGRAGPLGCRPPAGGRRQEDTVAAPKRKGQRRALFCGDNRSESFDPGQWAGAWGGGRQPAKRRRHGEDPTGEPGARGGTAPARGHHHGRQRPVGQGPGIAPAFGAPGRHGAAKGPDPAHQRPGHRGPVPVCIFHRKLETARRRGGSFAGVVYGIFPPGAGGAPRQWGVHPYPGGKARVPPKHTERLGGG